MRLTPEERREQLWEDIWKTVRLDYCSICNRPIVSELGRTTYDACTCRGSMDRTTPDTRTPKDIPGDQP